MAEEKAPKKTGATWDEIVREVASKLIVIAIVVGAVAWFLDKKYQERKTTTPEQRAAIEAAKAREELEKECTEKGLRFAGTIGGKVECRP